MTPEVSPSRAHEPRTGGIECRFQVFRRSGWSEVRLLYDGIGVVRLSAGECAGFRAEVALCTRRIPNSSYKKRIFSHRASFKRPSVHRGVSGMLWAMRFASAFSYVRGLRVLQKATLYAQMRWYRGEVSDDSRDEEEEDR